MQSDWTRTFSYITWERFSQNMQFLQNHKDNYGGSCKPKKSTSQDIPYWGVSPSTSRKFSHSCPPRKITHTKFLFLATPTTKQFSSYNPIKNSILSCRHCSCSIVLTSYSLETQVMLILILINIQDSEKAVSSFEKGWNWQNHSSSTPLPPVKCLILSTPLGKIYLLPPLTIIWKTLHQCKKCFVNSKRMYS